MKLKKAKSGVALLAMTIALAACSAGEPEQPAAKEESAPATDPRVGLAASKVTV